MVRINNMKKSKLRKIIRESLNNIIREREGQDDGDVTNYTVVYDETGETINVDRNHKMWREISRIAQSGKAQKGKQLTKGEESKNLREDKQILNEIFGCCWIRGGCCEWVKTANYGHYEDRPGYITISWSACCGNSGKGKCCGGRRTGKTASTGNYSAF